MYPSRTSLAPERIARLATRTLSPDALQWTLRVGAFLCFVGHGAFGIMTKQAWLPYFAVADVGPNTAYRLMPVIGMLDIAMGCVVLIRPRPAILYWMTLWAVWTALLRPLAGESPWEALERAGNYGVPAAMLILLAPRRNWRGLLEPVRLRELSPALLRRIRIALTVVVALLLVGHGALGLEGKPGLVSNYASLLPEELAARATPIVGAVEIVLAVATVRWPSVPLALSVAAWKLATESLFVVSGQSVWEIVERGGSYAAPVALAIVIGLASLNRRGRATPA